MTNEEEEIEKARAISLFTTTTSLFIIIIIIIILCYYYLLQKKIDMRMMIITSKYLLLTILTHSDQPAIIWYINVSLKHFAVSPCLGTVHVSYCEYESLSK